MLSPADWEEPQVHRRHRLLYVAGGPVASLVVALMLAECVRRSGVDVHALKQHWGAELAVLAATISFALGAGTLIPLRMGAGLKSDGLQLLHLLRIKRDDSGHMTLDVESHRSAAIVLSFDCRPRDWPAGLVAELPSLAQSERLLLEYHRAVDCGALHDAHALLQRGLDVASAAKTKRARDARAMLALEAAAFEGAWRRDAAAARAWRTTAGDVGSIDPHGGDVADAAIAFAESDAPRAQRALRAAERTARQRTILNFGVLRAGTLQRIAHIQPDSPPRVMRRQQRPA